jgi:peptide/nickel transport system substrate-binding protein
MLRKVWLVISILVVVTLLMGGCAPAATPTATEGPPPPEEPTPTEAPSPTEAPAAPKVLTHILWQDLIDLNPYDSYSIEIAVNNNCYENLVWFNPPGSEEMVRPGLATSWEKNEDATEWTFYLRDGVTFQDGLPFDAEAVKATFDYMLDRNFETGATWNWMGLESVEVIDDYTVKFNCEFPMAIDLIATMSYAAGIMSPAILDQPKEWFDAGNCVGTGPYMIESYERGQRLVMTRFDDYWGGWEDNQFDKIVMEIVEDPAMHLQMLEAGDADMMSNFPADHVERFDAMEHMTVGTGPSYQHTQFFFNTEVPPLDDILVRQALSYSFPYHELEERTNGLYPQMRGAVPAALWGYCEDCFQYEYDLDKARDLLEQAGYPDGGFELTMSYMADYAPETIPMELWPFHLEELGITLNLEGMTFPEQIARARGPEEQRQDIFNEAWWPDWTTPYSVMYALYTCEEEPWWNLSYTCFPEYDEMVAEGHELTGIDIDLASEKYQEAQEILVDNVVAMWICDIPDIWAVSADVEGFVANPAYPNVAFYYDLTTTR